MWNEQVLSQKNMLLFFIVASLLYVYPVVHADYAYIDDNWRVLLQAQDAWRNQGRVLLELLYKGLTFTSGTTNIFPLPLLISILALALAMTRLTLWYFPRPCVLSCLVVLPILCNPFFLGNLTYQYDGPGMVLAVVAVIYAVTSKIKQPVFRGVLSAALIAVTLSLYQPVISLFVGLCIVEYTCGIKNKLSVNEVLFLLAQRIVQLIVGGVIYFLTSYQMAVDERGKLQAFDARWLEVVWKKLIFAMRQIDLLVNPGNIVFAIFLLGVAVGGFVFLMRNISQMKGGAAGKGIVTLVYFLGLPVLLCSVPGVMLFVVEPNLDARSYVGFSAVLVFLLFLNYEFLGRIWLGLRWLLVIPVVFMFAFCYAYGQVIISKKELESAMASYIAKDIVSRVELRSISKFYYIGARAGNNWLPRGHDAMTYMPVLRYILSTSNTILHPQFFPRLGVNNVVEGNRVDFNQAVEANGGVMPVVDSKFYSIYVTSEVGFIVMKEILDSENYNDN